MKAVICPVCKGEGSEWSHTDIKRGDPDKVYMKFCHGCNGKGWVEVADESNLDNRLIPIPSITYSYPPDYNRCPACGGDRNSPAGTGCPVGIHYGTYAQG